MKVIQLIKTAIGGRWALLQVRELVNAGIEVHVVLSEQGPMLAQYRDVGARVHIINTDLIRVGLRGFYDSRRKLRALIDEIQPDIIHSHFVGTTLFMRLALPRGSAPLRIFQVPGPLHLEKPLIKRIEILLASASDRWIASCRKTRDIYLAEGINPAYVGLSYYGNEFSAPASSDARATIRAEFGIGPETQVIGMIAYMYAPRRWLGQKAGLKGHEDLIEATRILVDKGHDVVALFVGGAWGGQNWYEKEVRKLAATRLADRAIFTGSRNDIPAIYAALDVAVHPSHSENVGGAAESLKLAVPTVATNIGGFPDVVIEGETGFLAKPHAPNDLSNRIEACLADLNTAKAMAVRGQQLVTTTFDPIRTGEEVAKIYSSFLNGDSQVSDLNNQQTK